MQADGAPYVEAARNYDLATLRCLRRLGCPWGPATGGVFTRYALWPADLAVLCWLLAEGCPLDWTEVAAGYLAKELALAGADRPEDEEEVRVWLLEELQRHRQEEQQRYCRVRKRV